MGDQPADMEVHRFGHRRVDLHPPGLVGLLCRAELVPVGAGGHRHHRGVGRHQPERDRFVAPRLAQRGPTGLVAALVFGDEFLGRLHRNVVGLERHIGEERLARARTSAQVVDRLVDIELRGVELLGHHGLAAVLEPIHLVGQVEVAFAGFPVVRAAVALDQRAVETTRRRQVVRLLADMPFAGDRGAVAAVAQQRGHCDDPVVEHAEVTGSADMRLRDRLGHVAHAVAVVVDAGQQHRAGRRARRGDVEVGKAHAVPCQRVEVGRGDLAAVGADVAETPVVGQQQHDVGSRGGLR